MSHFPVTLAVSSGQVRSVPNRWVQTLGDAGDIHLMSDYVLRMVYPQ